MNKWKTKLIPFLLIAIVGIGLAVWLNIGSGRRSSVVFESRAITSPLGREEILTEKIIFSKEDTETIATLLSEKPAPINIKSISKDDITFLSENDIIDKKESETLLELENLLK